MIQGFGTREITDQILRAFVKSANGIMHEKQKVVGQYEQTVWPVSYTHLTLPTKA